jgi:hypothetical protein
MVVGMSPGGIKLTLKEKTKVISKVVLDVLLNDIISSGPFIVIAGIGFISFLVNFIVYHNRSAFFKGNVPFMATYIISVLFVVFVLMIGYGVWDIALKDIVLTFEQKLAYEEEKAKREVYNDSERKMLE